MENINEKVLKVSPISTGWKTIDFIVTGGETTLPNYASKDREFCGIEEEIINRKDSIPHNSC